MIRVRLKNDKVYPRARVRLNRAEIDTDTSGEADDHVEEVITRKMREKWVPQDKEPATVVDMKDFKTKDKRRNSQRVRLPYADPFAYNNDRHPTQAYRLRLMGATVNRIAEVFNVSPATLAIWRANFPDFNRAWLEGGEEADAVVAHSLFRRATGWSHKAEKIQFGEGGTVMRAEYIEKFAPDVNAAKFWLTNRQGGKQGAWNERKDVNHNISMGPPLLVPNAVTPQQLAPPTLDAGTIRQSTTAKDVDYDDGEDDV